MFGGAGTFGHASGPRAVPTEPVGWQEQLQQAFAELQRGTFLQPEGRG